MQTQTTQNQERKPSRYKRNLLELGVKDGISVKHSEDCYLLQMPDRYDLHYPFVGKNKPGELVEKVAPLDGTQKIKDAVIKIPLEALADPRTLDQVGQALAHARKTNIEMNQEIDLLSIQIAWKLTGGEQIKQPAPKAEQGKTVPMDVELLAVGKYFFSVRKLDENSDKPIVISIPTNRILKFQDGDYRDTVDRAERVRERLGITKDDYLHGDLKDGIKKTMHFDHRGNCTMVHDIGEKDIYKKSVEIDVSQTKTKAKQLAQTLN